MNDFKTKNVLIQSYKNIANYYKELKDKKEEISDLLMETISQGAYYIKNNCSYIGCDEGYKPYYDYLKYDNQYQEEPIMIEDNSNSNEVVYVDNNYEYTTPYSFEYEPYLLDNNYSITFDHEVDTSDSIEMIEELYNEESIEEEVDSNDVINIVAIIANRIKNNTKKKIIHYISNYRPIMNVHSKEIKAVLIE